MSIQTTKFKISIVIPVYNVEIYIERCLSSCINQSNVKLGVDYEIIIVNDGSPDNSAEIARRIINDKAGCRIINQENKGLGGARNTGIENASGEYIWFVDSDDWIADDSISKLLTAISFSERPDIVMFRAANILDDKVQIRQKEFESTEKVKTGIDLFCQGYLQTCAPFQIIKRSLFFDNNLRFIERIFHEDNEFMPRLAYYANRVACINDVLYFVFQNPNSITRSVNPKKAFDLITVCSNLIEFRDNHEISGRIKRHLNSFICLSFNNALNVIKNTSSNTKRLFRSKLHSQLQILKCYRESHNKSYQIEYYLMKLFGPILTYRLIKLMNRIER